MIVADTGRGPGRCCRVGCDCCSGSESLTAGVVSVVCVGMKIQGLEFSIQVKRMTRTAILHLFIENREALTGG